MTVYELIQELTQFDANKEVIFKIESDFNTYVEAEFDRNNEDDIQEVKAKVSVDEEIEFDCAYQGQYSWNKNNVLMVFTFD